MVSERNSFCLASVHFLEGILSADGIKTWKKDQDWAELIRPRAFSETSYLFEGQLKRFIHIVAKISTFLNSWQKMVEHMRYLYICFPEHL